MCQSKYAYFVTLADKTRHRVIIDRYDDDYTRECFVRQLEDAMRKEGRIVENRISIRTFSYQREVGPQDFTPHTGRAGAETLHVFQSRQ